VTIGTQDVRGVATTHYHATGRGGTAFDVWVDRNGLMRRISFSASAAGPEELTVTEEFFDFGLSVKIKLPPPGEVKTATILTLPTTTQSPFPRPDLPSTCADTGRAAT
jgi:hypothetical protein